MFFYAMYNYTIPELLLPQPLDSSLPQMAGIFFSPPPNPPPQPFAAQSAKQAFDSIREALAVLKSDVTNNNFSPPSSIPTYLHRPTSIQRSASSHSLQKDLYHLPSSSPFEEESMRKVFSTGDLKMINSLQQSQRLGSPLGQDNCGNEAVAKVSRYSPEERRERIERYRSKRNQRNFQKKIKYACRKTLADSRPRVRGRFAKNEDMVESSQSQWSQLGGDEEEEEDDDGWINFLDAFSMNLIP